jgi:hypothetical protein
MNRFLLPAAVLICSTLVLPIQAQVTIGLQAGYAFTGGDIYKAQALSSYVNGQIPFSIDAGYRFFRRLTIGGYAEVGPTLLEESSGAVHSVYDDIGRAALGVQIVWNFIPNATLQPWAGIGVGWEGMDLSHIMDLDTMPVIRTYKYRGIEFTRLLTGIDYRVARWLSIGPAVTIGFGRYKKCIVRELGSDTKVTLDEPAIHEWVSLSFRGSIVF